MKVHMLASMPHYARHCMAIWKHIPEDIRGECVVDRRARLDRIPEEDVVLIGGAYDLARTHGKIIYVEHGAGQSYNGDPSSSAYRHSNYAGGKHPRNVIGYISPRQDVADSWGRPAFAAGCPALDGIFADRAVRHPRRAVFTFHFDARICPESRSARNHYLDDLTVMIGHVRNQLGGNWEAYGHGHPRDTMAKTIWRNLGIEELGLTELLESASVLIADNTSVMYEAAALDIPVVVLNAPWYRRHVEHGLRFWSHVPGPEVDDAFEFCDVGLGSYIFEEKWARRRQEITEYVYAVDPKKHDAGPAAAAWVLELVGLK